MSRSAASVTFELVVLQAVVLHLLGQQVALRDVDLLVLGVARQADHFHPVEQRRRECSACSRCDEHHVATGRSRPRRSGRRTCGSAPDRAPRAAPTTDRRGSPSPSCRSRRAGTADCARRPWSCSAGSCRASSRCRCGDGRGSRPRRARRPAPCARTCGWSRARSTGRARSCRRPGGRRGTGSAPCSLSTRCCTARYSRMRSLTFSSP